MIEHKQLDKPANTKSPILFETDEAKEKRIQAQDLAAIALCKAMKEKNEAKAAKKKSESNNEPKIIK